MQIWVQIPMRWMFLWQTCMQKIRSTFLHVYLSIWKAKWKGKFHTCINKIGNYGKSLPCPEALYNCLQTGNGIMVCSDLEEKKTLVIFLMKIDLMIFLLITLLIAPGYECRLMSYAWSPFLDQFIVAVAVISTSQNNNCKRGLNCFVLKWN